MLVFWGLRILGALLATMIAIVLARRLAGVLGRVNAWLDRRFSGRTRGLGVAGVELVPLPAMTSALRAVLGSLRIAGVLLILYGWLLGVSFSLDRSRRVFDAIVAPLEGTFGRVGDAAIEFLPNVVVLAAILGLCVFATRVVRALSAALAAGKLTLRWLPRDLVPPTHRLVTIFIWAFGAIMAAPYLPGSDSKAFQGVTVFIGVLLSLGSTSVISNLLAGLVLTYTRAFRQGDRVRIGEVVGDVLSLGTFTTRVRTTKDEEVVIPNAVVQAAALVNFSTFAQGGGVQVSSQVTIGYDTPWRAVHRLLEGAARHVDGLLPAPAPYVLQKALDDFYVRYEIRAFCNVPHELHLVEGRLNQAIQDEFFREGVEICSPHFNSFRDGNGSTAPATMRGAAVVRQEEPRLVENSVRTPAP